MVCIMAKCISSCIQLYNKPSLDIADVGLGPNDSAINYFYGPDDDTSITIPAGNTISLSASLLPLAAVVARGIPF